MSFVAILIRPWVVTLTALFISKEISCKFAQFWSPAFPTSEGVVFARVVHCVLTESEEGLVQGAINDTG